GTGGSVGARIERAHASEEGTVWLQGAARVGREIRHVVRAGADRSIGSATPPRWRAEPLTGKPLRRLLTTTLYHDDANHTLWIGGHGALISRDLTWTPTRATAPPAAVVRRIETAEGKLLYANSIPAPSSQPSTLNSQLSSPHPEQN